MDESLHKLNDRVRAKKALRSKNYLFENPKMESTIYASLIDFLPIWKYRANSLLERTKYLFSLKYTPLNIIDSM
jgi:hypothetical protein